MCVNTRVHVRTQFRWQCASLRITNIIRPTVATMIPTDITSLRVMNRTDITSLRVMTLTNIASLRTMTALMTMPVLMTAEQDTPAYTRHRDSIMFYCPY